jgi:diketogulonate reductase-like aldo/keto reductase
MTVSTTKLSSGVSIPRIGLGTWQIKDQKQCIETVQTALRDGYRHFDTAQVYDNEQYIGQALKDSGIERKELFITTKIWTLNFLSSRVIPSFDKSLDKLQTDYVDLLLLHFPVPKLRNSAWKKMEEIKGSGNARAIGVSNYTIKHLKKLLEDCKVKPAVNQVELHVFLQQPDLLKYCKDQGIVVEAYSPLAHSYGLDNPVLARIAKKHSKSAAQIMLRWCIEVGTIPLPKSSTAARIAENIDIFNFKLDTSDLEEITALDANHRTCWDPTRIP